MTDEPLDVGLKYHAISYAWRDPYLFHDISSSNTEELIINGLSIQIQKNLASFFRHISHKHTSTDLVWVDALCINQQDIQERSVEGWRMYDINKSEQGFVYGWARNRCAKFGGMTLVDGVTKTCRIYPQGSCFGP